jgi:hypothetical protein
MSYSDPSLIRDVVIKVRLNDVEDELLEAVAKYTGQQKSTLMRELFMEQARLALAGFGDVGVLGRDREEPQMALQLSR